MFVMTKNTNFSAECVGRMFIITPYKSSFSKVRGMCLAMGGDLVQETLGEIGSVYHRCFS